MAGLGARKSATAGILLTVVVAMIGLSYAAVPLYRLFCQVTGYGGTPQVAEQAPGAASERVMTVRFNADVAPDLAWSFRPAQREVKARVGEEALAFFDALNDSNEAVTGRQWCLSWGDREKTSIRQRYLASPRVPRSGYPRTSDSRPTLPSRYAGIEEGRAP